MISANKEILIGLVGNPNSGKTTIFNRLTGSRQKVANWSGVTVEKREGILKHRDYRIRIVDLPGIYSLSPFSLEEIITRNFILDENPDIIINIVDAGNLERNLNLSTQLINIRARMIIGLNMYDEALARGVNIDYKKLGSLLGMPVVKMVGSKGEGINELIDAVISMIEGKNDTVRHIHIPYGTDIEEEIRNIQSVIRKEPLISSKYSTRWLAILLLEDDSEAQDRLKDYPVFNEIMQKATKSRLLFEKKYKEDIFYLMSEARQGFIAGALRETISMVEAPKRNITAIIDYLVLNKYLGYPILLSFLWLLFQMTYTLGEYPKNYINSGVDFLASVFSSVIPPGFFRNLIVDGVLHGVGAVIVFLPNILILFLGVSFMEDSGYMARAAFVMDRVMHRLGIHGKSFIPLIMGFGCNVPAIMATRALENQRDRIITILINPFMSCSARLPVYVLFAGVFFHDMAGTVIISLYLTGVLLAFISARIFKLIFFKGVSAPFVMELPPYRMPTARTILLHMWSRASQYLKKIGGIILLFSIIIWFLSNYPSCPRETAHPASTHAAVQSNTQVNLIEPHECTAIGRVGKAIEPVLAPLGFNWKMGVSLITGIAAKEIVISTMGILYQGGSGERGSQTQSLESSLKSIQSGITPLSAYIYMLFVLLYIPCIATITVIGKEIGWRWAAFSVLYNTSLTWIICYICHTAGVMLGFN